LPAVDLGDQLHHFHVLVAREQEDLENLQEQQQDVILYLR
jgi:hypothetical protein